jgi:hypothetical protein
MYPSLYERVQMSVQTEDESWLQRISAKKQISESFDCLGFIGRLACKLEVQLVRKVIRAAAESGQCT